MEAIALHFPVMKRTDGESRIVNRQWLDDLAGWPLDLISECARLWRNSGKERFPTPGQFKAPMEKVLVLRQAIGRRAQAFLEVAE